MGKITIRETSSVGESCSEVEYIFEDSSDYFAWRGRKLEFALLWAEKINDDRVTKALVNKYQNYEE